MLRSALSVAITEELENVFHLPVSLQYTITGPARFTLVQIWECADVVSRGTMDTSTYCAPQHYTCLPFFQHRAKKAILTKTETATEQEKQRTDRLKHLLFLIVTSLMPRAPMWPTALLCKRYPSVWMYSGIVSSWTGWGDLTSLHETAVQSCVDWHFW